MTQRQWPAETKQRAEKAMADLEGLWERFRASTPHGRRAELLQLPRIKSEMATLTSSDEYTLECLTKFADACRQMARLSQSHTFDESRAASYAIGDLSNLRSWLARFGLLQDSMPPDVPR